MAELKPTRPRPARRGPELPTLVVGLLALTIAVAALVGGIPAIAATDPRWVLAGGAAAMGLALLIGSVRNTRRRR